MYTWNGERLKRAITTRGFTQDEFAKAVTNFIKDNRLDREPADLQPVLQQYVNRWANNKVAPSAGYIAVMAAVLNTTADYFLNLTDELNSYDEANLSDTEKLLVEATRRGDFQEIMRLLADVDRG